MGGRPPTCQGEAEPASGGTSGSLLPELQGSACVVNAHGPEQQQPASPTPGAPSQDGRAAGQGPAGGRRRLGSQPVAVACGLVAQGWPGLRTSDPVGLGWGWECVRHKLPGGPGAGGLGSHFEDH